jgi:hypothetical protein
VKAALASDGPPRYVRVGSGSLVDGYDPRIRELLTAFPRMPATVIAERLGLPFSIRTLSGRVAELRPAYLPPDRRAGRPMPPVRSPSLISVSLISSCRLGSARPAPRGCCRC